MGNGEVRGASTQYLSVQRSACFVNVAFMSVFASVILFLPAKKKKLKKGEVFPNCGKNTFQMCLLSRD